MIMLKTRTHNLVVRAARGVGIARVATNANNGDGATLDTDEGIDGIDGETEESTNDIGGLGVGRLRVLIISVSFWSEHKMIIAGSTFWVCWQHSRLPVLHWLAGIAPAGTCLDSIIPAGVATARRGRASNKAAAV